MAMVAPTFAAASRSPPSRCDARDSRRSNAVFVGAQRAQRGEPGGHREWVPGERARLIDVAGRRHALEQRARSAVGADGQPAADDLAERGDVRPHAVPALRAVPRDAEPGHHLVEHEQRAVRVTEVAQRFEEPGRGWHDAHVARDRLNHDRRDAGVRLECRRDGRRVVERDDDGLRRERGGHARRVGQPERRDARAGGGEQPVGVAVVAAVELHDQVAPGRRARQAQGRHRRLGARVDETHHLDRRQCANHEFGELGLGLRRRAERRAARGRDLHGRDDLRVRAAENQRPERSEVVDVLVAVDVGEDRARAVCDHDRSPPTARYARAGELTPPGSTSRARSITARERS